MSHAQRFDWHSRDPGGSTIYVKPEPAEEPQHDIVVELLSRPGFGSQFAGVAAAHLRVALERWAAHLRNR